MASNVRPPPIVAPPFLAEIAAGVDLRIAGLLEAEEARWSALDPALVEPLSSLRDLVLAGGKRLRPAFCYWAYVGAGGNPGHSAIVDAGAALELLHVCALIHDDVIDGSTRRHGLDTVHIDYEARHAAAQWRVPDGEPPGVDGNCGIEQRVRGGAGGFAG